MKVAKVTTDNRFMVTESIFSRFHELIGNGCGIVEIVRPSGLAKIEKLRGVVMIVDEEGLCHKQIPDVNVLGSWLYGTIRHGHPIVGNILFVGENDADLRGLTASEIAEIRDMVNVLNNAPKGEYA